MPFREDYRRQIALLIRTLPAIAEEDCFALKGGTAINLFLRDLPRLSVDIDLTFLPVADRQESLSAIEQALKRISGRIRSAIPGVTIQESAPATQETINKLVVRTPDRVQTKIEVTPVLRGCVYEPQLMSVSAQVEEQFGFAEINVLSFADLYAGKITAALDRQHPRDLFDIHELLRNEGLADELRTALIVYLISHDHAPNQLLASESRDMTHEYEKDFVGMTQGDISLEALLLARAALGKDILANMPEDHKRFLISFYRRKPEWKRLGLPGADQLPAVRWRELNLDKAGEETRAFMVSELEKLLWP
ncbi:MAG: nucleotidyl transferase AbiEii/AbiGii toxin family protein [Gammaproteobacteria bacterium]|nr:nucleotidyl transferase AbiEii/AbiGii toxin family protein [Gammaproteobacteria bacterium]